jgi:adenylate kinase family enzyme
MSRRIVLKGTSGAGKTTLGNELARRLGVPFIELDAIHHGPNWSTDPVEVFREKVRDAMATAPNGWVIDGNYDTKLDDTVVAEADTIVWLDLPLPVKSLRVVRRTLRRIRNDEELWNGNKETWRNTFAARDSLLWYLVAAHRRHQREWPARFAADPRVVRLRSDDEVRRWLEGIG